jgi:hypothetical protein
MLILCNILLKLFLPEVTAVTGVTELSSRDLEHTANKKLT